MTDFIHTGDIHLGAKFNTATFGPVKGRRRREELWSSLRRLIKYALDNSIKLFLISGDLFESAYFSYRDMSRLSALLEEAGCIRFVIITGNHDMINVESVFKGWQWSNNVTVFTEETAHKIIFEDLGVAVHGISWKKAADTTELLDSISKEERFYNILLLHGDVSGSSKYMPIDKEKLIEMGMDYIALGHIHKPMFLEDNIAYCGSLEGLDFGETGRRGFIRGCLGEKSRFEFIPFSSRSFHVHKVSLDGSMSYSDIFKIASERIEQAGVEEFHRIILSGAAPLDFESASLFHELEKMCYHIEIIDESYPDFDIKQLLEDHDDDIIGGFIRSFSEDELSSNIGERALHLGLAALLEGGVANDH